MITKLHKACIGMCICLWGLTGSAKTHLSYEETDAQGPEPLNESYDESLNHSSGSIGESQYFGVRLGVNAPSVFFRGVSGVSTNTLCGMNLGMVYGLQLVPHARLFFETGLSYTEKGVKMPATATSQKTTHKMRYLEIPFVFKYSIDPGFDDLFIEPFFGGYFACGVGGQSKYFTDREKHTTFRSSTFRRPDAGFRMGCGITYRVFYLELSYEAGLVNIAGKHYQDFDFDPFDDKIRTGCFSATVGLNF